MIQMDNSMPDQVMTVVSTLNEYITNQLDFHDNELALPLDYLNDLFSVSTSAADVLDNIQVYPVNNYEWMIHTEFLDANVQYVFKDDTWYYRLCSDADEDVLVPGGTYEIIDYLSSLLSK